MVCFSLQNKSDVPALTAPDSLKKIKLKDRLGEPSSSAAVYSAEYENKEVINCRHQGARGAHFFSNVGKKFLRYEMSLSLIHSSNAPVAIDNRHLNFEKFVNLEQPITGNKFFKIYDIFFNTSSSISHGLLCLNYY